MPADVTVIILAFNEEKHLPRCLQSLRDVASRVIVVDCFSTDATVELVRAAGAEVVQHAWVNHSVQMNWALDNLPIDTQWTMRLDADEVVTPELAAALAREFPRCPAGVMGLTVNRQIHFLGRWIRHGGIYPIRTLRVWRTGHGRCENRWMDEHMAVEGGIAHIDADIADINLNSVTWWTDKHNHYASREAVDLLNLEYGFMLHDSVASLRGGKQAGVKRWLKEVVYARLPGGLRAFAYFFYRYVIRLGVLDGQAGTAFHFLQGCWYRYLVDTKVAETKRYMRDHDVSVTVAIERVLGIKV